MRTHSREASVPSTSSSDKDKDKVLCVCGVTTNDGKPMVQCIRCCAWSHLQCVRLTQRTAKKIMFHCHRCKGLPVNNKPSVNKPSVNKPSVSGKTRENLVCGSVSHCSAIPGRRSSKPPQKNPNAGSSQAPLTHPVPVSTTQIPTTCSQPMHLPSSSPCPSAPFSQPLPLGNHCSSVECAATPTIVEASAPTIDNCVYSKVDGVLSSANTQSTSTHSDCVTRAEVSSMLTKMESLIMASVNARLLALEEQVSGLTHTVHTLRERCKDTYPSSQRSSTRSRRRPSFLHSSDKTNSLSHQNSHSANSLPFRVVWGTPRSCSSQVVLKAICALLPDADRPSVTVKGSFRQRGSRVLWWYTIMAPIAVMQQIENAWYILEAKTSWSLRPSLSGHFRSHVDVADPQCPPIPPDSIPTAADPAPITVNAPTPVLSDVVCSSVHSGSTVTNAQEVSREQSGKASLSDSSPSTDTSSLTVTYTSSVLNSGLPPTGGVSIGVHQDPDADLPLASTCQAAVNSGTRSSTPFLDQLTSPEEAS